MLVRVAAGIVVREGQVFLAKRASHQHQGGLWEFPGGKCEVGESPEEALKRELQEEIAIKVGSPRLFEQVHHDYGDKQVNLYFFLVEEFQGEATGCEGQLTAWVDISRLADFEFPAANQIIVDKLIAG